MGWIGGMIIREDDELFSFAALNNLRGSGVKFRLHLFHDWNNQRCQ